MPEDEDPAAGCIIALILTMMLIVVVAGVRWYWRTYL